jgi:hypothetical protein
VPEGGAASVEKIAEDVFLLFVRAVDTQALEDVKRLKNIVQTVVTFIVGKSTVNWLLDKQGSGIVTDV